MAQDYYYIEEISQNLSEIPSVLKSKSKKNSEVMEDSSIIPETKRSQEIRLHEIEQQLEMAESRCNTLKGQVDYMKMLYNGMSNENPKPETAPQKPTFKRDTSTGKRRRKEKEWDREQKMVYNPSKSEEPIRDIDNRVDLKGYTMSNVSTVPHRDVCNKDANEAVKSINNIISGITNSVNRLTQLQVKISSPRNATTITSDSVGIQNIECLPRSSSQRPEKPYQTESKVARSKSKDNYKKTKKVKVLPSKHSTQINLSSMASIGDGKKKKMSLKNIDAKKTKITVPILAGGLRKKIGKLRTIASRTLLTKKSINIPNVNKTCSKIPNTSLYKSDKLIELYHNSNAKIRTASDDSIQINKRTTANTLKSVVDTRHRPFVKQDATAMFDKQEDTELHNNYRSTLTPIEEHNDKFRYGSSASYYNKNYELPTIASKMKQVAKTYFENFNFKTIPFVAARSITPSHNLGVNIQQVLSIIKGRKPVAGISPTLAYNIELAATKLGSRPLSCLVSTLGSRMNNKICPLSRRYLNMSHLQEIAKEIPEETIEELNEEAIDNIPDKITSLPFAAGDKNNPNNAERNWCSDSRAEKCTCLPKTGHPFKEIYEKYVPQSKNAIPKTVSPKKLRNRPWNANSKMLKTTKDTLTINESKVTTISRKEKTLKEILKNLYDEFADLNARYDELKIDVNEGSKPSKTLIQELEKMENILQNKEDEITMVMSLYKEVMALKQQVKVLKKRASQSTVVVSPLVSRQREYKEMNAAGHLTKLLRHIQQFQGSLKEKSP